MLLILPDMTNDEHTRLMVDLARGFGRSAVRFESGRIILNSSEVGIYRCYRTWRWEYRVMRWIAVWPTRPNTEWTRRPCRWWRWLSFTGWPSYITIPAHKVPAAVRLMDRLEE